MAKALAEGGWPGGAGGKLAGATTVTWEVMGSAIEAGTTGAGIRRGGGGGGGADGAAWAGAVPAAAGAAAAGPGGARPGGASPGGASPGGAGGKTGAGPVGTVAGEPGLVGGSSAGSFPVFVSLGLDLGRKWPRRAPVGGPSPSELNGVAAARAWRGNCPGRFAPQDSAPPREDWPPPLRRSRLKYW